MSTFRINAGFIGPLKRHLGKPLAEAGARLVRDEIKEAMEAAAPRTGREYVMPGTGTYADITMKDGTKKKRRVAGTGTTYTASAPGEPPAIREGTYRDSWQVTPAVEQGSKVVAYAYTALKTEDGKHLIGDLLEHGTQRLGSAGGGGSIVGYDAHMAPRPHIRPAVDAAAPKFRALVREASAQ